MTVRNTQGQDGTDDKPLTDDEIIVENRTGRRGFLSSLGIGLAGAGIAIFAASKAQAKDFPKGTADGDTTQNADLKATDSDQHNSKAVDTDRSRLRDARKSSDAD